jgi:Skp family chaperone for outer membrane proteins
MFVSALMQRLLQQQLVLQATKRKRLQLRNAMTLRLSAVGVSFKKFLCVWAGLCALPIFAAEVMTVSIDEVLKGSDHLAAYRSEFNASIEAQFAEAQTVLDSIHEIQSEIAILEEKEELTVEEQGVLLRFKKLLNDKSRTFQSLKQEADAIVNERREALFDLHTDDILEVIQDYCESEEISVVFPRDGSIILFSKDDLDLSDVILENLNAD